MIRERIFSIYRRLFARVHFARINRFLYELSLRGLGVLNYKSDRDSGEAAFLERHFRRSGGGVVIDVGANRGEYAQRLREINHDVEIHCFEPHPLTFATLRLRADQLRVTMHHAAVGSAPGEMSLFDYEDQDGSSHASAYREVIERIHGRKAIEHRVRVITLDDFARERGIERVSLLKIDTEGHEIEVLKGFSHFLREKRVAMIHFEFNEMNVVSRAFFRDYIDLLPNYDFYRMLPDGLLPLGEYHSIHYEIFAYQNVVAKLK
jgi:FkbM family methyltransferase